MGFRIGSETDPPDMPSDQPFNHLFETFGKLPSSHAESVNGREREELRELLDLGLDAAGHCILFKAPRAGHGKTHLLTRLQHDLGGTHEFIPMHAVAGSRIDAMTVLDDVLRRLVRGLPAAGGLTVLDLVARRLFSSALQPLVRSGEVPCQDRESALNALRNRPIETFDFHHQGAVTAHWAMENFELLGPRLALELSQRNGLSHREVSFWVDTMFRFAATSIDNPGRVRALAATVFEMPGAEAAASERLFALLGLMSSMMRVVLVADELEGFSLDETAALRFAAFVGSLRQSVDKAEVIISMNQDVWENAFLPRLSGGLSDRLSEVMIELQPLDRKGMLAIIDSRTQGRGRELLNEMAGGDIPTHARGVVREAGVAWAKMEGRGGKDVVLEEEGIALEKEQDEEKVEEKVEDEKDAGDPDYQGDGNLVVTEKPQPEPAPEKAGMADADPGSDPGEEPAVAAFAGNEEASGQEEDFAMSAEGGSGDPAAKPGWTPVKEDSGFQGDSDTPFLQSPASRPMYQPEQVFLKREGGGSEGFSSSEEAGDTEKGGGGGKGGEVESPFQIDDTAGDGAGGSADVGRDLNPGREKGGGDSATDRVDDLLRQFRERYGKP